jgi:hypothetical protein
LVDVGWRMLAVMALAASASPASAKEAAPPCMSAWSEVRPRYPGYDHVVHIVSRCSAEIVCTVTTDVSADLHEERVAPDSEVEVLTFRGSPASEFRAQIVCR